LHVPKKKVVVLPGDDSAPDTVYAAMEVMRALEIPLEFVEFPPGEHWVRGETNKAAIAAIDASDSTLFGSTSGKTTAVGYLRWGKRTYANVRPCRHLKGFAVPSPIRRASIS
jgi:isocitrate/isopropylmalate dehydrogenase